MGLSSRVGFGAGKSSRRLLVYIFVTVMLYYRSFREIKQKITLILGYSLKGSFYQPMSAQSTRTIQSFAPSSLLEPQRNLSDIPSNFRAGAFYQNDSIAKLQRADIDRALVYGKEYGGCPEIIAAIEHHDNFILSSKRPRQPPPNVTMLQLVGKWDNDAKMERLFNEIFEQNAKLARRHGYGAQQIVEAPRGVGYGRVGSIPAYWKMAAILETCQADPLIDVVWFLDGDIVVVDPSYQIHYLWEYHQYWVQLDGPSYGHNITVPPVLDWLFTSGPTATTANSGNFLVNCRSKTSLQLLEMFTPLCRKIRPISLRSNYEQNAVHWLMIWRNAKKARHHRFNPVGVYDTDNFTFSHKAINKRLRITLQECGLSSSECDNTSIAAYQAGPRCFSPGHSTVHTAGLREHTARIKVLTKYLNASRAALVKLDSFSSS
jgi:hypothetical protein